MQSNNAHYGDAGVSRQLSFFFPPPFCWVQYGGTHKVPKLNMNITEIFLRIDRFRWLSSYRGRHMVTRSRIMLTTAPAHACALMLLQWYGPGYSPSQRSQAALSGWHWNTEMRTQTMR